MTDTYDWKGGNGAFNDADKWKPKGVPGLDDNADFAKGGTINGDGGGVFEVAFLSIEANVTFASVNGSYSPDVDATTGLSVYGGDLKLNSGSVLSTSLGGIQEGQPPASADINDGGKILVSEAHLNVNAGGLIVGDNSTGSLTLEKSGVAIITTSSPDYAALTLGASAGASGSLTVTSDASLTLSEGGINFGYSGAAKVVVSDGGTITTDQTGDADAAVGLGATSTGSGNLTIEGAGSAVTIGGGALNDGFAGKGIVTVKEGASLSITYPDIGINMAGADGGNGSLIVNAATLTDDGEMFVGDLGTGKYVQEGGATANIGSGVDPSVAPAVALAVEAGSAGAATITGAKTSLDSVGQLDIGLSGKASFAVQDGATVTSGDSSGKTSAGLALGLYTGSDGTMKVTGAGSAITNTGLFVIASDGKAAVTISDGGSISTSIAAALGVDGADLGAASGSNGTLTVDASSSFTDMSDLVVGASGKGTLNANGGTVTAAGALYLGEFSGGKGSATISNGAALSAGNVTLGDDEKSTGTLTITGASKLLYGGTLAVGAAGDGTLTIAAGALVETGTGGTGAITIGTGSASKAALMVDGTLDGANLTMGRHSGSTVTKAALAIEGGTVNLTGIAQVNDVAAITLANGTLGAASLDFMGGSLFGYGTVNAAVSAPKITETGGTLDITGAISGTSGHLTLDSGATLTLGSSVSARIDIDFASSNATTLQLSDPTSMAGKIEDFAAGSTIDLLGATYKSLGYNTKNGHLTIHQASGPNIVLDFAGSYSKTSFDVSAISGGIAITHS